MAITKGGRGEGPPCFISTEFLFGEAGGRGENEICGKKVEQRMERDEEWLRLIRGDRTKEGRTNRPRPERGA